MKIDRGERRKPCLKRPSNGYTNSKVSTGIEMSGNRFLIGRAERGPLSCALFSASLPHLQGLRDNTMSQYPSNE